VITRAGERRAAVGGEKEADVVALGGAGDELETELQRRGVTWKVACVDDVQNRHRRDRDVVGRAVVAARGDVVDARLRGRARTDEQEKDGEKKRRGGAVARRSSGPSGH
jgi:hypothetical protein